LTLEELLVIESIKQTRTLGARHLDAPFVKADPYSNLHVIVNHVVALTFVERHANTAWTPCSSPSATMRCSTPGR
jgi:hypothetical protein